jgi:DNA-binding transcriptional ArsR family regulator
MRKQSNVSAFNTDSVLEYECCLLGSYIGGASIGDGISVNVFYDSRNREAFRAIAALLADGVKPDLVTVTAALRENGKLDAAGGAAYVSELTSAVATSGNKGFYEKQVLQAYRRREQLAALETAKEALETDTDFDRALQTARAAWETINAETGSAKRGAKPILIADLLKKRFPPKRFFIERILTPGLTVFSGASKSGKSWMSLQILQALDTGGYFLGTLKAENTAACYFSLEDGEEAVFHRLQKQGNTAFSGSYLATEKMTFKELDVFLDRNSKVKVVVIDTWQKFAGVTDSNDYALNVDTAGRLKDIADRHGAAIVVIAHLRKTQSEGGDHLNETLGSIGLVATADATWTLKRKRGEGTARFFCSGRNIEDAEFSMRWDREIASWKIEDAGELKPAIPEAQQQIIGLLESEAREWATAEVAALTGKTPSAVSNLLKRLEEAGYAENPYHGQWRAKSKFTNSHFLRESEYVNLESRTESA